MNRESREVAGAPVLELRGITRRFGSVVALDQASIAVRPGTVHAVLGENGAGKTTLMRVAFGLIKPNGGDVLVRGRTVQFSSPSDALAAGIGMVHQHFTLVPAMTVAENVAMGGRGLYSAGAWAERVRDIGERTGLVLDPAARVSELSVSAQQRTEIVKALSRDVDLLILDEPTAVLAPGEAQELLRWMRAFADAGRSIVLITHKLRDALAIAADITVLRHGRTVLSTTAASTSEAELAAAMLGSARSVPQSGAAVENVEAASRNIARKTESEIVARRKVLQLDAVSVHDDRRVLRLRNVSLDVHAGEIVGVAAVEGAGQRELLRVLSGRMHASSGSVSIPEHIGFVPEDRHNDALLLDASLVENVALKGAGARDGRMPWTQFRAATDNIIERNDVKAEGALVNARTLSGGNLQKLILGREMSDAPSALVVENPTRGLDFRSTAAVHDSLRAARDHGTAVVVFSSDLDEVLQLADRAVVVHDGRVMQVPLERDVIGRAMLGTVDP